MKALMTVVMAATLAYLSATWAEETTPGVEDYQASIIAFGLTESEAGQAAEAAIAELEKRQTNMASVTEEPDDSYSGISSAWLANPYHIE